MSQSFTTHTIEYQFKQRLVQDGQDDTLIPVDVSGASIIRLRWRPPTGSIFDRTFANGLFWFTDGTDGVVRYKFANAEALAGEWEVQGYVEWTGISHFHSDRKVFYLKANIEDP